MKKWTLQHTGRPIAGRPIEEDEWRNLSTHASFQAAWRRIGKNTAHLSPGSWDDHYRILDPGGKVMDYELAMSIINDAIAERIYRAH